MKKLLIVSLLCITGSMAFAKTSPCLAKDQAKLKDTVNDVVKMSLELKENNSRLTKVRLAKKVTDGLLIVNHIDSKHSKEMNAKEKLHIAKVKNTLKSME